HLRGDRAVDVQLVEPADVHHLIDLLEDVDEAAAVAQALVDRVLATLDTAAHGAARLLALGTAPGGLPLAGPVTTADAGPLFPRSRRGLQIVQLHRVSLLYLYALASRGAHVRTRLRPRSAPGGAPYRSCRARTGCPASP